MRKITVVLLVLVAGAIAFYVGTRLSADAIGMAVGMVFGVLASVPTALLLMSAGRKGAPDPVQDTRQLPSPYAPPVIVWHEPAQLQAPVQQQQQRQAPAARRPERFSVVGEHEEWIKEW